MSEQNNFVRVKSVDQFRRIMQEAGLQTKPVIVAFTDSRCPHCRHLLPKFEEAASRTPDVWFLEVDRFKIPELQHLHNVFEIQGVPTVLKLKAYEKNKRRMTAAYDGDRSVNSISDFARTSELTQSHSLVWCPRESNSK